MRLRSCLLLGVVAAFFFVTVAASHDDDESRRRGRASLGCPLWGVQADITGARLLLRSPLHSAGSLIGTSRRLQPPIREAGDTLA